MRHDNPDQPGGNPAMAVHGVEGDRHVVGIGNLRVSIGRDGSCWYAQGLEIDYLALGHSVEEARKHFEEGLTDTVHEHLRIHGHIEHFLTPAPPSEWKEVMKDALLYSQVSVHRTPVRDPNLPFGAIEYYSRESGNPDVAGRRSPA